MNKKGMFFTLITIIFLVIFIFYFSMGSYQRLNKRMFIVEERVKTMNNFISSAERDISRGLYIASFRAILSLEEKIATDGEFISDLDEVFYELVINGTIDNASAPLSYGFTFNDWIDRIKNKGNEFRINISIAENGIDIYHEDPWKITIGANITLYADDKSGIASWKRNSYVKAYIDIEGFEDPVYIIKTYGRVINVINSTPYEGNYVNTSTWNTSNLVKHARGSYYSNHGNSPSFLMRLQGNLGSSPYGIESMVSIEKLNKEGVLGIYNQLGINYDKSIVDHVFFDFTSGANKCYINNTPGWVKLDTTHGHVSRYDCGSMGVVCS